MYYYATRGLGFLVRCATISRQLGQGRQRSGGSPLFMINHRSSTTTAEIWKFLGISILMGIHRLPRINNYWSRDKFLGLPVLQDYMSYSRFWSLWTNLHVVDNHSLPATRGLSRKVKPMLDTLDRTFLQCYNPSQQLAVYKGHVKSKVHMPKKLIKTVSKIWSCSCSCCVYLCTFQLLLAKQ